MNLRLGKIRIWMHRVMVYANMIKFVMLVLILDAVREMSPLWLIGCLAVFVVGIVFDIKKVLPDEAEYTMMLSKSFRKLCQDVEELKEQNRLEYSGPTPEQMVESIEDLRKKLKGLK